MRRKQESVFQRLAAEAVLPGADTLEVEYKDGHEEVVAVRGAIGQGDSTPEEFQSRGSVPPPRTPWHRGSPWITTNNEVRRRVYESFGEGAFRLTLKPAI